MIRRDAIKIVSENLRKNPIVSANGFMSRDLFEVNDKESNFYMIGSMGLASSIGLGIALKNPKKRVFVFDGDGNILMNLGSLVTIGSMVAKNLVHIVFDNSSHESTGGQPTMTSKIDLQKIAKTVNYKTFKIKTLTELKELLIKLKTINGPILVLIKIKNSIKVSKRVRHKPKKIREQFMDFLEDDN